MAWERLIAAISELETGGSSDDDGVDEEVEEEVRTRERASRRREGKMGTREKSENDVE
ncbi:hypothetical protein HPP92_018394 [Vanilla planifolia]|uniref:Uncharacterized protein n=1 Tax=Vanilla planifolia TaxID=51239 RepID=A0A835QE05_VANPL|nr:hypothetical protein HPP92_018394 [Vanilla planifolia]